MKNWASSKTLWIALVVVAIGILNARFNWVKDANDLSIVISSVGASFYGLRLKTSKPVSFRKEAQNDSRRSGKGLP